MSRNLAAGKRDRSTPGGGLNSGRRHDDRDGGHNQCQGDQGNEGRRRSRVVAFGRRAAAIGVGLADHRGRAGSVCRSVHRAIAAIGAAGHPRLRRAGPARAETKPPGRQHDAEADRGDAPGEHQHIDRMRARPIRVNVLGRHAFGSRLRSAAALRNQGRSRRRM